MAKGWEGRGAPALGGAAALVLVGAGALSAAAGAQQRTPAPTSTVFDGVTVVDVEHGKLLPDQRVVITGNRIRAVGGVGSVSLPKGAQVVPARGKYLIPGLWDLHVHTGGYPQFFYPLFIANGVTGVREMSHPFLDSLIQLRREIINGARIGPRMLVTGGYLGAQEVDQKLKTGWERGRLQIVVTTAAQGRRAVDSLQASGADFIKVRDGLTREAYFAVAAEARRLGIPLVGHLSDGVSEVEASDSGQRTIEHARMMAFAMPDPNKVIPACAPPNSDPDPVSDSACAVLASHFIHNHTWYVPTLSFVMYSNYNVDSATEAAHLRYWPDSVAEVQLSRVFSGGLLSFGDSARTIDMVGRMHRAGVPLLAGTDVGIIFVNLIAPGVSLHRELALFVQAGLTPLEALQTATFNPARYLNATDSLGTVASGKLADLVLLDANPLADIGNTTTIRAVVANGRYFDRAELDSLLADVRAKAKQKP